MLISILQKMEGCLELSVPFSYLHYLSCELELPWPSWTPRLSLLYSGRLLSPGCAPLLPVQPEHSYPQYSRAGIGLTSVFISQGPVLHYPMHNVWKLFFHIFCLGLFLFFPPVVSSRRLNSVIVTSSWLEAADR